jgi:predicted Rossmann fold flavoprotein
MHINTLVLGAGAAGLMAASQSGPDTLIIDHARAPGEKIRISGGGRCNFTNLGCSPEAFLGQNPHFHKSALSRYTAFDFLDLVEKHRIAWHEKTLGQLFCDGSARQIVRMLLDECSAANLWLQTRLVDLSHDGSRFHVNLEKEGQRHAITARNLIVATGGKSIPKMGATGLAYDIAAKFGHTTTETRAGLVPFTFPDGRFKPLAGVSLPIRASCAQAQFDEAMLFTHRGLSGPAILQISSYWSPGQEVILDLFPDRSVTDAVQQARATRPRQQLSTVMATLLPDRLVAHLAPDLPLDGQLANLSNRDITALSAQLHRWSVTPQGTEGYRTAEVTLGGITTRDIDSKTMMSRHCKGLYFIGECVDVTGWLGGYNFQWALASGQAAGQVARTQGNV